MRADIVRHLRCPVCAGSLSIAGPSLRCPRGHSFDPARGGYVQLTAGPLAHTGDSAEMISARAAFLAAGHFAPITRALRTAASAWPGDLVLDVGAGTGTHLAGVLDGLPDAFGLAVDASRPAVRRAARCHPRADAIICDAWRPLPLRDASVGVALNVFAPRPGAEFARVLRPDGRLLVVTPTPAHLAELIRPLELLRVDPDKAERVADSLAAAFECTGDIAVATTMTLDHEAVSTLVGMGPSAWHTDPATRAARIAALPVRTEVTLSVTLSSYRPRPTGS